MNNPKGNILWSRSDRFFSAGLVCLLTILIGKIFGDWALTVLLILITFAWISCLAYEKGVDYKDNEGNDLPDLSTKED